MTICQKCSFFRTLYDPQGVAAYQCLSRLKIRFEPMFGQQVEENILSPERSVGKCYDFSAKEKEDKHRELTRRWWKDAFYFATQGPKVELEDETTE